VRLQQRAHFLVMALKFFFTLQERESERCSGPFQPSNWPRLGSDSPDFLDILEERHEAEVHVQLLVAVEQRQAWVIRNKIHVGFLVASEHHDIF
jgi:hypothetical protein